MKINYNFSLDDYLEFLKYHTYNSKSYKYSKIFYSIIIPLILIYQVIMRYLEYGYLQTSYIIVKIVIVLLLVLFVTFFSKKITLLRLKYFLKHAKIDKHIGDQVMDLNNDSFTVKNNSSTSELKWDSVLRIETTDKYIFLYNSNVSAHIIPIYQLGEQIEELKKIIDIKKTEYSIDSK